MIILYLLLNLWSKNLSSIGIQGYIKATTEYYILYNTIAQDIYKLNSDIYLIRELGTRNLCEKYRPEQVIWATQMFEPLSEEAKLRIRNITNYWPGLEKKNVIVVDWPVEPDEDYIVRFFRGVPPQQQLDDWFDPVKKK